MKKGLDTATKMVHSGGMRKLPVTIHLDADLKAWLDQEAKRRRCSLSQVIRELILEKLSS